MVLNLIHRFLRAPKTKTDSGY